VAGLSPRGHRIDTWGEAIMTRPLACLAFATVAFVALSAREQGQTREFSITGNNHQFSPSRIEVQKDDLVKITFTAADIPHSFTNEQYRISKRAGAGQAVTFEFRADQAGTFEFYCNLKQDERCRDMKGTLVVR
jgi:cytochrome c oxidase subunit 2